MIGHGEYWKQYDWAKPLADEELRLNPVTEPREDYKQFLPPDPSHSRAWIPPYVRYAKRSQVQFICPITGWGENDWYRGKHGNGPFKKVGILTMDHIIPGAAGGKTTDENIRAISLLANMKKGSKQVSDDKLRESILVAYELVTMPEDLLIVLIKYGITSYRVGG